MARAKKENVEYFPHNCSHGKTMFIVENQFGNDGFATWFKILEMLGDASNHYIDLRDRGEVLHVAARCRVSPETLEEILIMF